MSGDSATVMSKSFGPKCDKFPGRDAVRTHYTKSNTYRWKCCGRQSRLHPVTLVGGNDPVPQTAAVSPTGSGAQVPPQEPAPPTEHSAVANRSAADGASDPAPRKSISQNFGRNCNLFPDRDAIRIYYPNCHRFKWKCCEKQSRLHPVTEVGGDPPTTANASLAQPPVQAAVLGDDDDDDHNEQSGQHPVEVEATDSVAMPVSAEAMKSNAADLPNQVLANGLDASMQGVVSSPPIGGRSETVPVSLTSLRYPSSERFDSTMSVSLDVGQPGPQLEAVATQRPPLPLEAESNRYQEVQVSGIENGSQAECKVVKDMRTGQLLFTKRVKRLGEMTRRYEKALQASKYLLVPKTPLHLMKYIGIELGVDNEKTDYFDIYMPFVSGTVQLTPSACGSVPIKPLCCLALGASRGLLELHGMGLLHRDVKPANILFIPNANGRGYRSVVIDVELGKEVDSAEKVPSITPTHRYASPEEWRHESAEGPADVYRLGMTLLHLLVGETEWKYLCDRRSPDMAIRRELLVEALKIRVQHNDVERASAVCDIIQNTLCSQPSERYTLEQILCRISLVYSDNDSANLKVADFGPTRNVVKVIENVSAGSPADVETPIRSETTENVSDDSTPGLSSLPAHRESD